MSAHGPNKSRPFSSKILAFSGAAPGTQTAEDAETAEAARTAETPESGNDLRLLLDVLPSDLQQALEHVDLDQLLEVVLDLGRLPLARLPSQAIPLSPLPLTQATLQFVAERVGRFSEDNRAGVERTLHRISAIRNREGVIIGLTLRVGRAITGTIDFLRDLIESGLNILLLGRPGVGKTTKLRELARILADDYQKRVIVVDSSNEIGGEGDIPHPAIGSARRMQVAYPAKQHAVMIEAVENHMPEVIIIDEIGTAAEAMAARTIAERGVQLIGTAHGTTMENLLMNPTLSDLIGGVHTVTLSDEEARRRRSPKTINERKTSPTFDILIEIVSPEEVIVHPRVADSVDMLLRGVDPEAERRQRDSDGRTQIEELRESAIASPLATRQGRFPAIGRAHAPSRPAGAEAAPGGEGLLKIYTYALNRSLLTRVIRNEGIEARTVDDPSEANMIISLESRSDDNRLQKILGETAVPLYSIKKNSSSHMRRLLREVFADIEGITELDVREAVSETEFAIQRVISENIEVSLAPRSHSLRKMQHRIAARYHLESRSIGREPSRHLVIYPH